MKQSFKNARCYLTILLLLSLINCNKNVEINNPTPAGKGYPRLAMWWPDTWEQSLEQLKRYDWIGFGEWDNMEAVADLKELNPDQRHFMDFSITETSWGWWSEKKSILEKIPSQWFLTQRGTWLAQDVDATQTTIPVNAVIAEDGTPLFEINDTICCEFESMKVVGIDVNARTLTVERGFVRKAASHGKGVRIAAHITFWPTSWVMNMSTLCPRVDLQDGKGPQQWIDYASRHFAPRGDWDGLIVDRIEDSQSWLIPTWCRNIDPDCSNRKITDDYSAFDAAWYQGCEQFLEYLHQVYPDLVIISNTSGAYHQLLNGAIYEGFPGNWSNSEPETYDDWAERALGENGYINVSKSGLMPNYSLVETYEDEEGPEGSLDYDNPFEQPGFVPNYQKMRFGLTTALLGDGYFSYEINTNGHGGLGLMWFDEYDNGGRARGYLGMPLADARQWTRVADGWTWMREFENGIVICNPTNARVVVNLGGEYRLIKGSQVPDINSGALVKKVTLQPGDGRILLRR